MNLAQHRSYEVSLDRPRTRFEVEQELLRVILYGTVATNFINYLHGGNPVTRRGVDTGVPLFRPEKARELVDALVAEKFHEVGFVNPGFLL